jgi:hypothetical protein
VKQGCGRIVIQAAQAEDIHLLSLGRTQVRSITLIRTPARRSTESQWILSPDNEGEGSEKDKIKHRKKDTTLKFTDSVGYILPPLPKEGEELGHAQNSV